MANKGFIFITRPNFRLIVSRFEVWPVAKICHSIDGSRQRLHELRTISDRIGVRILRLEIRHITKVTHLRSTARSVVCARAYNRPRKARIESLSSGATATAIKPAAITRPPARLFISGERRSTVLCLPIGAAVRLLSTIPSSITDSRTSTTTAYITVTRMCGRA